MSDILKDRSTLQERVLEVIIDSLKTGERLPPEKKLAEQFGVSRSALREVLSGFEASGVLVSLQGSGRYVQMPDVSTSIAEGWSISLRAKPALLLELLEVRSVLEVGFLPKVIERLEFDDLQALHQLVEAMAKKAARGEDFVEEDQEFHRILFTSTGNVMLSQLLKAFWDLYNQTNALKQHQDLEQAAEQHRQLLKALIRKNTSLAIQIMSEQMADARYQITLALSRQHSLFHSRT